MFHEIEQHAALILKIYLMSMQKKPVSIKRQSIYACIPYVNLWAFYRIQKLRKFILIVFAVGLASYPLQWFLLSNIDVSNLTNPFDIYSDPLFIMFAVATNASLLALFVYLIRRWSRKWNEQFQTENS